MLAQRSRTSCGVSTCCGSGDPFDVTYTLPLFGLSTRRGAVTCPSFSTFTRKSRVPPSTCCGTAGPCLDADAALGVDLHDREHVLVERGLDLLHRRGLVGPADSRIEGATVGFGKRLPEIIQRGFNPPRLLRERLHRDGRLGQRRRKRLGRLACGQGGGAGQQCRREFRERHGQ